MTHAEIRGRLLKRFYELGDVNGGWVPTSEIILSPDSISRQAVADACQHLAEAGYIRWEPFNPPMEQHSIGKAKITGTGIDVVTEARESTIDIRFPDMGLNMSWIDEIERLLEGQNIDSVAISKPNENHIILRDEVSGQSIEIMSAEANLFRMKEDLGNLRGGFQTQVTSQPARWSLNGHPITREEVVANTRRWLSERRQLASVSDGISAEGRRARFERWEKLGLDRVKADLVNGGHQIIGGPPAVRELAWDWVRIKEAEAASLAPSSTALSEGSRSSRPNAPETASTLPSLAEAPKSELLTLKPSLWGVGIDLKEAWRRLRSWWKGQK